MSLVILISSILGSETGESGGGGGGTTPSTVTFNSVDVTFNGTTVTFT